MIPTKEVNTAQMSRGEVPQATRPAEPPPAYRSPATEAAGLVHRNRGADYSRPLEDFSAVATAMNAYLRKKYGSDAACLDAEDIPIFQICVKIMREAERPKHDNRVDIAGYAEALEMVHYDLGNH